MFASEAIQELRERVLVAKGIRSVQWAAASIGISPITLRNWLKGISTPTIETLTTIENWCAQHERRDDA